MKVGEIWSSKITKEFSVKILVLRFKINGVETENILSKVIKTNQGTVPIGYLFCLLREDFLKNFEKDYNESR